MADVTLELLLQLKDEASEALKGFGSSLDGIGSKTQEIGGMFKDMGEKMSLYVTTPLVGLATVADDQFGKFNESIQRAGAYADASQEQIKEFYNVAIEASQHTGYTAQQAADALGAFVGGTITAAEASKDLGKVIELGMIAKMDDLNEAVDFSSLALKQFSSEGLDMNGIMDTMAAVASNVTTQTDQYANAFTQAAAASHLAGMSFKETNVLISILSDSGADLNVVGTAINSMLRFLEAPTKGAAAAMSEMGISATQMHDALANPVQMLELLKKGFDEAQKSGQGMVWLTDVVGREAAPTIGLAMAQTSASLQNVAGYFDDITGSGDKMVTKLKEATPTIDLLKEAYSNFNLTVGPIIDRTFRPLVIELGNLIDQFSKLPAPVQNTIVIVAAIAAAIGPLLIGLGLLVSAIGSAAIAFGFLATVMAFILSPIGLIIIAIAALVAAIVLVALNWKTVWANIQATFQGEMDLLEKRLTEFEDFWTNLWNGMMNTLKSAWGVISPIINDVSKGVSGIGGFLSNVGNGISAGLGLNNVIKVKDAVITPGGQVVQTDPSDYLFATKNPGSLAGAGSGGVVINITGGTYMDANSVRRLFNQMARQINQSNKLRTF